jgi:predicted phage tail protein
MNEGVSAPITLDWEDATDSSAPVTYSVQVSASESFTSLLIDKTGLGTSQYMITDSEMLSFTAGQTYYWRERAVDAASNASAWTGANAFVVEQGFSFSGWVMWVTIAVVGVILFLVGIWIGRKTAYSY